MNDILINILENNADIGDVVLDKVVEIEQVLIELKKLDKQSSHLKEVNQYRTEQTKVRIDEIDRRSGELRKLILNTMRTHDPTTKTFEFPTLAKVQRRSSKPSYQIEDESLLTQSLHKLGRLSEVIVERDPIMNKVAAKKLAAALIDEGKKVEGVSLKKEGDTLGISWEDEKPTKTTKTTKTKSKVSTSPTLDGLDEL